MGRDTIKQAAAQFIAFIIVMLPLCSMPSYAQAFGQPYITITKMAGEDNINGYIHTWRAGKGDTLKLELEVYHPDPAGGADVIQGDQIRLYSSSSTAPVTPFKDTDCVKSGADAYTCTYTRNFDWVTGTRTYTVKLYSDAEKSYSEGTPSAEDSAELVVDSVGAAVVQASVFPTKAASGSVRLSFAAEDYAISEGDTSKCSGIKKVELFLDSTSGTPLNSKPYNPKICTANDSFDYDISSLSDGTHRLCAVATDYFGQQGAGAAKCATFTIDSTPPSALTETLRIVDRETNSELNFIGDAEKSVDIYLNLLSSDLELSSVRADLSKLGGARYISVSPTYTSAIGSGQYALKWSNIKVKSVQACSFRMQANDKAGNSMDVEVPCGLSYDNKGPVVIDLVTNAVKSGTYYLGRNTTLIARMREEGAGLSRRQVYLDISSITSEGRRQADNCTRVGGVNWECYWNIILSGEKEGFYNLAVSRESFDDIMNPMSAPHRQEIGVDTVSPLMITNPNISGKIGGGAGGGMFGQDVFLRGDTLVIIAQVDGEVTATADLTGVGGSADAAGECWEENSTRYCKWEVRVANSGPYNGDIMLTITDFAGNSYSYPVEVPVSGLINDTRPDYWMNGGANCYPSADRQMTLQAPGGLKVYCDTEITANSGRAIPYLVEMPNFVIGCAITKVNGQATSDVDVTDYINSVRLVNNYGGSTHPYFSINLAEMNFADVTDFDLTCRLNVFTKLELRSGYYAYTVYPEFEDVTMNIKFYDIPYGDIGTAFEGKINRALGRAEDWDYFVTDWYDFIKQMEDYCQLQSTVTNSLTMITFAQALIGSGANEPGSGSAWEALCKGDMGGRKSWATNLQKVFDVTCAFVNCKYSEVFNSSDSATGRWFSGMSMMIPSPKESLFWSVLTLCVPGMAKHTYIARDMNCQMAYCMVHDVPLGYPQEFCGRTYDYQWCVFQTGQIFNSIPYVQVYDRMLKEIQSVVADPGKLLGWILTLLEVCTNPAECDWETGKWKVIGCSLLNAANMIGKSIEDLERIEATEGWGEEPEGYCDKLLDEYGDTLDLDFLED